MKRLKPVLALVGILAVALLGWWPEHQRRVAIEQELGQTRARVATLEVAASLCELRDRLLSLLDLIVARNFGAAQGVSSAFFDGVRAEAIRAGAPPELDKILAQRDEVTAAIARNDPTVADVLGAMRAPLAQMQSDVTAKPSAPAQ